jgi:hypothetical protein
MFSNAFSYTALAVAALTLAVIVALAALAHALFGLQTFW